MATGWGELRKSQGNYAPLRLGRIRASRCGRVAAHLWILAIALLASARLNRI
jgi:hypothetical protein